jgi:hypothetical protein
MYLNIIQVYTNFQDLVLSSTLNMRKGENRALRRVSGPRREVVSGGWRRLHNEELQKLYAPPNIIKVIIPMCVRWDGYAARMGEMRNVYNILVAKPKCRWEDIIKMDLRVRGREGVDWINLVQYRVQWQALVNMVMDLRVP